MFKKGGEFLEKLEAHVEKIILAIVSPSVSFKMINFLTK